MAPPSSSSGKQPADDASPGLALPVYNHGVVINGKNDIAMTVGKERMDDRSTASITVEEMEKRTMSNPLVVTKDENLINTLVLEFSLWQETDNREYLQAMLDSMDQAVPDIKHGSQAANEGITAFYDFTSLMTFEEANKVAEELKVTKPHISILDPCLIQIVQHILCTEAIGNELPYENLAFFLGSSANWDKTVMTPKFKKALVMVELHNQHKQIWTTSEDSQMSKGDFRLLLSCVKNMIEQTDKYIQDSAQALADQHGGILRHGSLEDLMGKLGNAVDIAEAQSYWEQLGAFHAVLHASGDRKASEMLQMLSALLEKALLVGGEK